MPQTSAAGATLPVDANLENLKKQAKSLLRKARTGDHDAVLRLNAPQARPIDPAAAKLSDAQFAIAAEYGFASWTKLKVACNEQSGGAAVSPITGPTEVPMLPLRDLVLFPGATVPLFIGRSKSLKALDVSLEDKRLLVCTQHDAQTDEVTESEVFKTGTIVTPLQLLKPADGTVKVLVEGRQTVQVDALDFSGDYTRATVSPLPPPDRELSTELVEQARELFVRLASHLGLSPKLADTFRETADVERLVGLAIQNFAVGVEHQQSLLEMADTAERLDHALAQFTRLEDELRSMRLEDYIGRYQLAPDFLVDIAIHNDSLIASTPWESHRLQPRGGELFVPVAESTNVSEAPSGLPTTTIVGSYWSIKYRFGRNAQGQVTSLTRSDNGGNWPEGRRSQRSIETGTTPRVSATSLNRHVGRYEMAPGKEKSVFVRGGNLVCGDHELQPLSDADFVGKDGALRISFKLNNAGRTVGMRFRTPHLTLNYYKMD